MAAIGDLDGDGLGEVAVTGYATGRILVLFLKRDGTVRAHSLILATDPVFGGTAKVGDFQRLRAERNRRPRP